MNEFARPPLADIRRHHPAHRHARPVRAPQSRNIWMLLLVFYSALIPAGLQFSLGSITLPPYRMLLIVLLVLSLVKWQQMRLRLILADYAIVIGGLWVFVAMSTTSGAGEAIEASGQMLVDIFGSYCVGRVALRSMGDLRKFLLLALPGMAFIGAIYAFEAITHTLTVQQIFPTKRWDNVAYQSRYGLLRAWGPFAHPIGGGMFLTAMAPLYLFILPGGPQRITGAIASYCGVFSVSTAAFLNAGFPLVIIAYAAASRIFAKKLLWWPLLTLIIGGSTFIQMFVGGGLGGWLARNIALDPVTARFRLQIWEYGSASVEDNPWFGIGYASYERAEWMNSDTVDNYWLNMAMRFGIPVAAALGVAFITTLVRLGKRSTQVAQHDQMMYVALLASLASYGIMAWTVNLWGTFMISFYYMLGIAATLSTLREEAPQPAQHRRTMARGPNPDFGPRGAPVPANRRH